MGRSRRTRARGKKTHPTMMSFWEGKKRRETDAVQPAREPLLLQRIADLEERMTRLEASLDWGTEAAAEPDEAADPREHEVVDEAIDSDSDTR